MTDHSPLAARMRPTNLAEIVGQEKWIGPGSSLGRAVAQGTLSSVILWGPPGCGKTTLAHCLATSSGLRFVRLSAVLDGIKQLRTVLEDAVAIQRLEARGTVLFVDEIHRWNKAQQDALLPHVERGDILLIGATTENPSFEVIPALRSRLQIVHLDPLQSKDILALLTRALNEDTALKERGVQVDEGALRRLADAAGGDARRALSDLERCIDSLSAGSTLTEELLPELLSRSDIRHDRNGEDHYNVLSALIKSMRGSSPDAAVYWLARLLAGGEPPSAIARRLVIFAAEDVGNADPRALQVAVSAAQAVQFVGMPEIRIVLSQAVTWLATCPKSNAAYAAINSALMDVKQYGALPVPLHLRNPVTKEAREEGAGQGYLYPHDHPHHIVKQTFRPEVLEGQVYYVPTNHGVEKTISERMRWWRKKLNE